jgi:hypothetical protein
MDRDGAIPGRRRVEPNAGHDAARVRRTEAGQEATVLPRDGSVRKEKVVSDAARAPYKKSVHQYLVEVIEWAADAAREAVERDRYYGEETSEDFGIGLWQYFLVKYREVPPGHDRDILCTALSATYRATVRAILAAEKEKNS